MANATNYGVLTSASEDLGYISTVGQVEVWDTTSDQLAGYNQDIDREFAPFVEKTTFAHNFRYFTAGAGEMQEVDNANNFGAPGEVGAGPSWDVAFPLRDHQDGIAAPGVVLAYMSQGRWESQVETVQNRNTNKLRSSALRALFNNQPTPFNDTTWGTLNLSPLANGDAVLYPPVIGSTRLAAQNNYLGSPSDLTQGSVGSFALNDSTNPIPRIVRKLVGFFGVATGGRRIVVFINSDQRAAVEHLADFKEVTPIYTKLGDNTPTLTTYPEDLPGEVVGQTNGAVIVVWDFISSGYMFGMHLDSTGPLIRRLDPPQTGIPAGLHLANPGMNADWPISQWYYRNRFGFAVGNRLNGVVVDLTAAGGANTYTVPAMYA